MLVEAKDRRKMVHFIEVCGRGVSSWASACCMNTDVSASMGPHIS